MGIRISTTGCHINTLLDWSPFACTVAGFFFWEFSFSCSICECEILAHISNKSWQKVVTARFLTFYSSSYSFRWMIVGFNSFGERIFVIFDYYFLYLNMTVTFLVWLFTFFLIFSGWTRHSLKWDRHRIRSHQYLNNAVFTCNELQDGSYPGRDFKKRSERGREIQEKGTGNNLIWINWRKREFFC